MRRKRRSLSEEEKIFVAGGGLAVTRRVSREAALRLEAYGAIRREFDSSTGAQLGWRVVGLENRRVDSDLSTLHSSATIDRCEMELNIARSQTRGLPEAERLARIANGLPPEDRIERVQAKVRVYLRVGPARGDVLRVWPR